MTATVYVLFLLSTVVSLNYQPLKILSDTIAATNVEVENFQSCPEYPNTPVRLNDVVISKSGQNKFIINGHFDILETLDRPLRLEIEMHRCYSKGDRGSFEYYFTLKKNQICDLVKKQMILDYFLNGTDLPKSCPFEKGSYTINGSSIDTRDLQWIPLFDSFWKIKSRTYMKYKLMLCLKSTLVVKRKI